MNQKRVLGFAIFSLLFVSVLAGIVTAADAAPGITSSDWTGYKSITNAFGNVLYTLGTIGDMPGFVKVLFFVLLFLIVYSIVTIIPLFRGRSTVSILVSLVVSVLGVAYMPTDLVMMIINPYTAMGATILSIIPIILLFFFTKRVVTNNFLKGLVWFIFAVTLLTLTFMATVAKPDNVFAWIYGGASIVALIMSIFHRQIDNMIWKGEMEQRVTRAKQRLQTKTALANLRMQEAASEGLIPEA